MTSLSSCGSNIGSQYECYHSYWSNLYLSPSLSFTHTYIHAHKQLQRYEEAEKAYAKAVQLDSSYKDASDELFQIRIEQLQVRCSHKSAYFIVLHTRTVYMNVYLL
jgi:tetratricopeptide (TPR) repeat protein